MRIRYTPEQIKELVSILIRNETYHGQILLMFLKKKSTVVGAICENDSEILHRMSMFRWTKYVGNYPQKNIKKEMKKVRDILFNIPKNRLPLHINDPLTGPISAWRLQNNL